MGTSSTRLVSPENPLGQNQEDPNGKDDLVVPELHLPIGKPVKLLLRSVDVLHDFYVPEFRAKMDLVPGMVTYVWLTPTRTGQFEILCAELCGVGHPMMRGTVIVDEAADYHAWLDRQTAPTRLAATLPAGAQATGSEVAP
jgi:cytochrome c oxidase subunit 2